MKTTAESSGTITPITIAASDTATVLTTDIAEAKGFSFKIFIVANFSCNGSNTTNFEYKLSVDAEQSTIYTAEHKSGGSTPAYGITWVTPSMGGTGTYTVNLHVTNIGDTHSLDIISANMSATIVYV